VRRALLASCLCVVACGGGETSGPAATVVDDVIALQAAVAADTCPSAMEDIDRSVDEDKPVLAARLLRSAGVPSAARQVQRVRDVTTHTAQGDALKQEGARLYDARRAALVLYGDALERGVVEDMQLIMALEAQRQADSELHAFLVRLEALRPLNAPEAESEDETAIGDDTFGSDPEESPR